MYQIFNREDLTTLLAQEKVVLFFHTNWSAYSVQGLQVMNTVELEYIGKAGQPDVTFWLADVSSIESPAGFMRGWVMGHGPDSKQRLIAIMTGNGSVAWIREGKVVEFTRSAVNEGVEVLIERTKGIFSEGAI